MALVFSAQQMRAVDRAAIDQWGLPGAVLMENAGRAVFHALMRACPRAQRVRVLCGAGQNGGDGFVVARHLANAGVPVQLLLVAPADKITGDAAIHAAALRAMGDVPIRQAAGETDPATWDGWLQDADVIVDAIFGIGLRADVTGAAAAAIQAANRTTAFRVAVDVPSGLDADSGTTRGVAFAADLTVTMGARKLGLVLDPEAPVGQVEVADLGVSMDTLAPQAATHGPLCHWLDHQMIGPSLPRRSPGAHKGSAGHLLIVAGSPGRTGAALLCARSGLRMGAGLVTIASSPAGQAALDAKVIEAMTTAYDPTDATAAFDAVTSAVPAMKAAVVGPGIPTGGAMPALIARVAATLPVPVVVDADALNLLGTEAPRLLTGAAAPRVLTPHPGEMARLVGGTTAQVQGDRLGQARRLAAATGAVVVLKGARTIVAVADGTAFINPTANPSLGTAGSGDVLAGAIGALLAQGLPAAQAACAAVFLHGAAADQATAALGTRLLVAGDLPDALARVFEQQRRL